MYECDNGSNVTEGFRALNHITDEHIYEGKIRKKKVKHAVQIFSSRVASTLRLASVVGKYTKLNIFQVWKNGCKLFLITY